jgi:hypothetical protein
VEILELEAASSMGMWDRTAFAVDMEEMGRWVDSSEADTPNDYMDSEDVTLPACFQVLQEGCICRH